MKRLCFSLILLALLAAACSPASLPPTTAPSDTAAPAVTAAVSTAEASSSASSTPAATTLVPAAATAVASPAVTSGGPVVITVLPSNGTPQPAATALPPTPLPTLPSGLPPTELKYHVLAAFPNLFFCDPDFYPVARGDEAALAQARFPEIKANPEEYQAILAHTSLTGIASFAPDQMLVIYREYKKLAAVRFQLAPGDKYQFQLQTKDPSSGKGQLITGLIDGTGAISATQSQPSVATCPICLAATTLIDTPRGLTLVTDLRPGDLVWTVDAAGARVAAPILQTVRVPVPPTHQMVHLALDDGRQLWASPGHPTPDGRPLGSLAAGDRLDGARVTLAERVTYGQPATYDLLPDSATGFYWANGILMGSTLK
jgi:hypothetical protein